ncbi:MAG TPA: Uma2 family endonuclease [Chloroflexota bacterium]|nr:Uma2 family endonuclease [Chloroflexota bacterium]
MVTARTRYDDPDRWPESDGKPMAENATNRIQMTNLIFCLEQALAPRVRFCVGGNQMMYYDITDRRKHLSPDVYVALDVAPGIREKWQTWREGGLFPQVAFEITSDSTVKEDLGSKRALYARLGVEEYYVFDPAGELRPAFQCFWRQDGHLLPVPVSDQRLYSPLLELELRVVDSWLRVIDPATGLPIPTPEEERQAHWAAEQARLVAEQARQEAESARQEAEERAVRLAAELRAALARLAQSPDQTEG